MSTYTHRSGFSLVEVSLAIFVVGVGLLTLFGLFPAGLNQAVSAQDNTQEALFAEYLFSALREEVRQMTDQQWQNGTFTSVQTGAAQPVGVSNWPVTGRYIRYHAEISPVGQDIWGVALWIRAGQYGASNIARFKEGATSFYTELVRF